MSARDGHLGDHAAALVDGALDADARDRALAHITGCRECRAEIDSQRALKERLRHSGDPALSPSLTDRLRAIGTPTDTSRILVPAASQPSAAVPAPPMTPPTTMPKPRTPVPVAGRRPGGSAPTSPAPARTRSSRSRRSRQARRVTGSVGVVALGVAAALTMGLLRDQAPAVSPPVGAYEVEHARTTGGVPGTDPGAVVIVPANR